MLKPRYKGTTIEIKLPNEYKNYSVECTYRYIKPKEKYELSMWLKYDAVRDRFRIESQEIDTQLIPGTKETIQDNVCRIVEQMCAAKSFKEYVSRYKYTYKCFDKGNEIIENAKTTDTTNESN